MSRNVYFNNCVFKCKNTTAVKLTSGKGRFNECTFLGGTDKEAIYLEDYGFGSYDLYNCTVMKNGTAIYAIRVNEYGQWQDDVLIVSELSRLGRSMLEIMTLLCELPSYACLI